MSGDNAVVNYANPSITALKTDEGFKSIPYSFSSSVAYTAYLSPPSISKKKIYIIQKRVRRTRQEQYKTYLHSTAMHSNTYRVVALVAFTIEVHVHSTLLSSHSLR